MHCDNNQPAKRSKRWSILPAITVNGYLKDVLIYQGSITTEIYLDWLANSVLPQTQPSQILIMDNASIHKDHRVGELVAAYGCQLEFLPPYSPDYNPIEKSFCLLKQWIKRHCNEATLYDDFGEFLAYAVDEFSDGSAA